TVMLNRCSTRTQYLYQLGRSTEQSLANPAAGLAAGRDGEDGGADGGGPFVEQVGFGEAGLDGKELAGDVGLVGGEDEAGVGCAVGRGGVVVVIGPAVDAQVVVVGAGSSDVSAGVDDWQA